MAQRAVSPTIAGERLELSRFMPPSAVAHRVFAGLLATIAVALASAANLFMVSP